MAANRVFGLDRPSLLSLITGRTAGSFRGPAGFCGIALGIFFKVLFASRGAEIIGLVFMSALEAGSLGLAFIHIQAADGVLGDLAEHPRGRQPHAGLRVDEEIAGDHDALARFEPLDNFRPFSQAPPGLNPARFEKTFVPVDEYGLLEP